MLKCGGRGHSVSGVLGTREGELAVKCPVCPRPGVNLPPGWEFAPEDKRFLYSLFVGIDANFRNKRRNVSSDKTDPGLSKGWSFVVKEKQYKECLGGHKDAVEVTDLDMEQHLVLTLPFRLAHAMLIMQSTRQKVGTCMVWQRLELVELIVHVTI
jgi:hypothetical protein